MPRTIPVDLLEEACSIALGPHIEGALLRPESRAAIEAAPPDPSGIGFRTPMCTLEVAEDMLDFYGHTADALSIWGDPKAMACARAQDNIRHALWVAGV